MMHNKSGNVIVCERDDVADIVSKGIGLSLEPKVEKGGVFVFLTENRVDSGVGKMCGPRITFFLVAGVYLSLLLEPVRSIVAKYTRDST